MPSDLSLLNALSPKHIYDTHGFDRISAKRGDEAWIKARLKKPTTKILAMNGLKCLVDTSDDLRLMVFRPDGIKNLIPDNAIFLGLVENEAWFAAETEGLDQESLDYVEVRQIAKDLPRYQSGLLAFARAIMHWRVLNRYCGVCGTKMIIDEAGHRHRCPGCGQLVFPRVDPAVIVLVHDGGSRCVLGRSWRLPAEIYSTLAGFVEAGESLEEAVRREIFEEVGLKIVECKYVSSQPWPFPQSLMLGFEARAEYAQIVKDPAEIEDAQWYEKDLLLDPERCPIKLPNEDSIAHYLIRRWLDQN